MKQKLNALRLVRIIPLLVDERVDTMIPNTMIMRLSELLTILPKSGLEHVRVLLTRRENSDGETVIDLPQQIEHLTTAGYVSDDDIMALTPFIDVQFLEHNHLGVPLRTRFVLIRNTLSREVCCSAPITIPHLTDLSIRLDFESGCKCEVHGAVRIASLLVNRLFAQSKAA